MTKEIAVLQERALAAAMVAQEKAVAAALQAAERAVSKAEVSNEKRFDTQNEFRGQLKDQAATLATKVELQQMFTTMGDKVADQEKRMDQAFVAFNEKMNMIQSRVERAESKAEGSKQGVGTIAGFVIGAIGCVGGVTGIVAAIISFTR